MTLLYNLLILLFMTAVGELLTHYFFTSRVKHNEMVTHY
ncbi:hypothetical protein KP78_33090 [Jeotgalibacillus soli]|uniref:Uncharacterized protein n=1 Tax=Jeotgalibacillus soli TaxID=889306 RepID=A0A0C2R213_9BACL|nr:hypothetical protein KP78_33090 [Jeotgalibacillus soli]